MNKRSIFLYIIGCILFSSCENLSSEREDFYQKVRAMDERGKEIKLEAKGIREIQFSVPDRERFIKMIRKEGFEKELPDDFFELPLMQRLHLNRYVKYFELEKRSLDIYVSPNGEVNMTEFDDKERWN